MSDMSRLLAEQDPPAIEFQASFSRGLTTVGMGHPILTPDQLPNPTIDGDVQNPFQPAEWDSSFEGHHTEEVAAHSEDRYPDAAHTYGHGRCFLDAFNADQHSDKRRENVFYPFASGDEWAIASYLLRCSLSTKEVDEFLALRLVSICLALAPCIFLQ
jgi:hypothetical protein